MAPEPVGGELQRLIHVYLIVITSLSYCYFLSSKIPKGPFRLISLLPIFFIFTILPLHLSSAFFTAVMTFFFTWLANFKLILFAFDQGPLSLPNSKNSLLIFITSAAFPIRMKGNSVSDRKTLKKLLPLNLGAETLVCAVLMATVKSIRDELNPVIVMVFYCFLVFLMVEILVAISSFVVRSFTGLELEPPSDEPYLSTSLEEFWGRRWNLTVTNTLRQTVYRPVWAFAGKLFGDDPARLVAVMASFLVSGLMHELLFFYAARDKVKPSWEMTCFFVVQGVGVVVEKWVGRRWRRKRLPWYVSGPLTVGFVVLTSFWLFFPPLMRDGLDRAVTEELRAFSEMVRIKIVELISVIQNGYQKFIL